MGNLLTIRDEQGQQRYEYNKFRYLFKPYDHRIIQNIYVSDKNILEYEQYTQMFVLTEQFAKFDAQKITADQKVSWSTLSAKLTILLQSERRTTPEYMQMIYAQLQNFPFPPANLFQYYSLFSMIDDDQRLSMGENDPLVTVIFNDTYSNTYADVFEQLGYDRIYSINDGQLYDTHEKNTHAEDLVQVLQEKNQIIVCATAADCGINFLLPDAKNISTLTKLHTFLPHNLQQILCVSYATHKNHAPHIILMFGEHHSRSEESSYHDIINTFIRLNKDELKLPTHLFIESGLDKYMYDSTDYTKYSIHESHKHTDLVSNVLNFHEIDVDRIEITRIFIRYLGGTKKHLSKILDYGRIIFQTIFEMYANLLNIVYNADVVLSKFSNIIPNTNNEVKDDDRQMKKIRSALSTVPMIEQKIKLLQDVDQSKREVIFNYILNKSIELLHKHFKKQVSDLKTDGDGLVEQPYYAIKYFAVFSSVNLLDLLFVDKLFKFDRQSLIFCIVGHAHLEGISDILHLITQDNTDQEIKYIDNDRMITISDSNDYIIDKEDKQKFQAAQIIAPVKQNNSIDFQQQLCDILVSLQATFAHDAQLADHDVQSTNATDVQLIESMDETHGGYSPFDFFAVVIVSIIGIIIITISAAFKKIVQNTQPIKNQSPHMSSTPYIFSTPYMSGMTLRYAT